MRGICCLRPGVAGLSENIRVRSIVGRYLEHGRIFFFANGTGTGQPAWYIGSADLMPRNLDRRVEALVPVTEPDLQAQLQEILQVNLADDVLAWELGPDGTWRREPSGDGRPSTPTSRCRRSPSSQTRRRRHDHRSSELVTPSSAR